MNSSDSPVPVAEPTSTPDLPPNGPEKLTFSESEMLTGAPPSEAVSHVTAEVKVGGTLGGYRLLKKLGEGGMGFVFEAEDARLKRHVAMKVMKPDVAVKDALRHRFLREAQAAATIEHDYIVPIHQVGEEGNVPFIVMPFLKGEPLDARLKRGRLDISEIITFGRQTAEGLAAAHEHGLIHRDIKPANIWLETTKTMGTRVRILDFGLARISGDEAHLTQSGAIMGTPAYMAPEQARGWEVDARADLFSLGCVLFEMCTGQRPFTGSDAMAILSSLALDIPAEPILLNPELPPALSQIIVKLLEKDASKRPASAKEVVDALKRLMPETAVVVIATKEKSEVASPWANIDASSTEIAPPPSVEPVAPKKSAGEGQTEVPTPSGRHAAEPRKSKTGLLIGGGLLGLAALIAVIIVIIRDKDGNKVAEIKVPGGGSVEIREDGSKKKDPIGKVEPPKDTPNRFKNALDMEFALVPKGKSWLGGGKDKLGNKEVVIAQDFYLGVYEVTQEEWERVTKTNPSTFKSVPGVANEEQKRLPVEYVSWDDCQLFIKRLNEQAKEAGWEYRLPTEVEWEYACRGGPMKDRSESGFDYYLDKPSNALLPAQANINLSEWKRTCKVGSYLPNRLGLYDMHGNVWEWCQDEAPADPKDPKGASLRVNRGGSWGHDSVYCRAASRDVYSSSKGHISRGLRLARVPISEFSVNPLTVDEKEAKKQQEDAAKKLNLPVEATSKLGMKMILIPPAGAALPKAYYLGKYEVTQGEWEKVMGYNPSQFGPTNAKVAGMDTRKFPVEMVSWFDSVEFCNKLSEQEGLKPYYDLKATMRGGKENKQIDDAEVKILGGNGYHIPTDAEWTHGCAAGSKTKYHFGDKEDDLPAYAWFDKNNEGRAHAVGGKKPNAFGLYDMHGNVREWNEEMLTNAMTGAPERVYRGGNWAITADKSTVSDRARHAPGAPRYYSNGLRVARVPISEFSVNPPTFDEKEAKKQQEEWATKLKLPVEATNKLGMKMILIPPAGEALPKAYYLGKYEVTQGEWEKVMGYNPSNFGKMDTSKFPVEKVSWFDSVEFCNRLSEQEELKPYYDLKVTKRDGKDSKQIEEAEVKILGGNGYHIPTDAEWTHGCLAGSKTKYHFGDKDEDLPDYAWFKENSEGRTHAVGEKKPNGFGLYDMHGNVREWIEMLTNAATGAPDRVSRGGDWVAPAGSCAVINRSRPGPAPRHNYIGLRLARNRESEAPLNPPPFVPPTFDEKEAKKQQEDWAAKLKLPVEATNKIGMKMVLIPPAGAALPKAYYLGKYEVTQGEWEKVMGYNPSGFSATGREKAKVTGVDTSSFPVETISWFDSVEFSNKLSEQEGLKPYYDLTVTKRNGPSITEAEVKILGGSGYHIPTDAEWTYGCAAGSKTKYHFGDKDEQLPEYAWFKDNSGERTHGVGEKKPNAFGLFDMHGNIWEWNEEMLTNAAGAPERVFRGGLWSYPAGHCEVSHRNRSGPAIRTFHNGLRLARTPSSEAPVNPPPFVPPTFDEKEAKKQQEDAATKLKLPVEATSKLGMKMILIPPAGAALPKPYYLGKYEVTQKEWEKVMGYNPSAFNANNPKVAGMDTSVFPVEMANWFDSVEFCNKLSVMEGLKPYYDLKVTKRFGKDSKQIEEAEVTILGGGGYHIPTDLEWEHGCRAGTKTKYYCGDSDEVLLDYAWFDNNSDGRTHAVGGKKPNGFGLYDMHGNVREWTLETQMSPMASAAERASRGGHYSYPAFFCAVSSRNRTGTIRRYANYGLRVARVPLSEVPVNPPPFVLPTFDEKEAKKQQEEWATKLKLPVEATNKIGMKTILIPPAGEALPKPYYLGKYEVTQGEWTQVMGYNPSAFGPKHPKVAGMDTSKFPVVSVSWFDSVEFCNKLSEQEGLKPYYDLTVTKRSGKESKQIEDAEVKILGGYGYHIPTDTEWTWGCAAGSKTQYHFGDKDNDLPEYAWFKDNSGDRTHAVGEKKPNAFGLYDMHGNVWEWNEEMLTHASTGAPDRVLRGGDWSSTAGRDCSVSRRLRHRPANLLNYGLRLGRVP